MRKRSRLILALDETDEGKALGVVQEVGDLVDAVKINWPLIVSSSPSIITKVSKMANVICDFKVADIPNTNKLITREAARLGASGIIVQAFPGPDSVRAVVDASEGMDVFVVTEMSHPGGEEFTAPLAEKFARIAMDCDATGVIAPATRPDRIKKIRAIVGSKLILSPGVGAQGGTATSAIFMGADHVIVGRTIYADPQPREAASRICQEIRALI